MPIISIFTFEKLPGIFQVCKVLNKKFDEAWLTARESKYNKNEIFIQYWCYENVEESLKRVFYEDDSYEIVSFLKQNGKSKVLKRTYCFINLLTKTLEIYRGLDEKTRKIVSLMQELLKIKFQPLSLKAEDLKKIYSQHSLELKQVMFKNCYGLIYDILRGDYLEKNEKFNQYLQSFPECLRVISFRPKIRFLNNHNKYQVTINGDKGTVRLSSNEVFQWRPRYEIRQIIFLIAATVGILPSTI